MISHVVGHVISRVTGRVIGHVTGRVTGYVVAHVSMLKHFWQTKCHPCSQIILYCYMTPWRWGLRRRVS